MVNYVEFGDSTRLNTSMGEALSNAQGPPVDGTGAPEEEPLPPDDTSKHLQHSPPEKSAENLQIPPTEEDDGVPTDILVEPQGAAEAVIASHDENTSESGNLSAVEGSEAKDDQKSGEDDKTTDSTDPVC